NTNPLLLPHLINNHRLSTTKLIIIRHTSKCQVRARIRSGSHKPKHIGCGVPSGNAEGVFLARAWRGRVGVPVVRVEGHETREGGVVVGGVGGLRVAGERDVNEAGRIRIAEGVSNYHLPIIWRSGVWLCAVDGNGLPGYVAVAGALVE